MLNICVYLWITVNDEYPGTSKIYCQDLIPKLDPVAQSHRPALRLAHRLIIQTKQAIC
jgi:hypothetical protein